MIKSASGVLRQAKELGLSTQFILATAIGSPAFLEPAGDAAIGCLQFYAVPYLIDSPDPLIADFVKKMKETYRVPPGRPSFAELMGIGGAIVAVEGLRRAGRDLTWEKYINAVESIKDFKTGFIMPTTFSATDHNGIKGGKLLAVLPGKKWSVLAEDLVVREKVEKIQ